MKRRDFVRLIAGTAVAGAIAPQAMADGTRKYESETISVQLVEEEPGVTALYLTEHGKADYVVVEAFYWTTVNLMGKPQRLLRSKETTTPLVKGVALGANLPMPVASIEFLRVREMKLMGQSEFGKVPRA